MRSGQTLYRSQAIYFLPESINPVPEVFVDITETMVPGVLNYYMISNYGRLWHKYKNCFLTPNVDSKGYLYKPLAVIGGGSTNCRIHRLVMLGFNYYPGCENMWVNHKDGNKCNPCIWNLEWCTPTDNIIHAIENGLTVYDNTISDSKVHEICKLLENPSIPLKTVSEKVGVSYTLVQAIQNKRTHTDISDQYNISQRKINNNLSIDEVHSICRYFQDHKKDNKETVDMYCIRALNSIGYSEPNTRLRKTVKKIYWKETYRYVSYYYNF